MSNTPKVAVYGIDKTPNNFSRAIEGYGMCHQHMTDFDRLPHPELNFSVVILTERQLSHHRFKAVKDNCRKHNIPCLITNNGFSKIKEEFEKLLLDKNYCSSIQEEKKFSFKEQTVGKFKYSKEMRDRRDALILECANAEMSAKDTVEMLTAEGFVRPSDGKSYGSAEIHTMRMKLRKRVKSSVSESKKEKQSIVSKIETVDEKLELNKVRNFVVKIKNIHADESLSSREKLCKIDDILNSRDLITFSSNQYFTNDVMPKPIIDLISTDILGKNKVLLTLGLEDAVAIIQLNKDIIEFVKKFSNKKENE